MTSIVAPSVGSQFWTRETPGTNSGMIRPCASSVGTPAGDQIVGLEDVVGGALRVAAHGGST